MAKDRQHERLIFKGSEINHHYGENVHLLSSPFMLSVLAKLGNQETKQPLVNGLISILYNHLLDYVIDLKFPKKMACIETRMKAFHPEADYEGEIIDPEMSCVTVDLARAGTYPSHTCFEKLNLLFNSDNIRQDHFYIARQVDHNGQVIGVTTSGSKIGGSVDNAIVLFPDPMGATGSTIIEVYQHYKKRVGGVPLFMIAMHLIVTPEYLMNVSKQCPDLHIFAIRLDRGLSPQNILNEEPGKFWTMEKGLNDHQYIVPGAGGLGEVLNNSYC